MATHGLKPSRWLTQQLHCREPHACTTLRSPWLRGGVPFNCRWERQLPVENRTCSDDPDIARRSTGNAAQVVLHAEKPVRPGCPVEVVEGSVVTDGPDVVGRGAPDVVEVVPAPVAANAVDPEACAIPSSDEPAAAYEPYAFGQEPPHSLDPSVGCVEGLPNAGVPTQDRTPIAREPHIAVREPPYAE